jgi:hypothetical protein
MLAIDTEFLSAAEVKDLTGTAQPDAQEAQLKLQGLPCKRRGRRVLVSRYHLREWLSGRPVTPSRGAKLELVS